MWVKVKNAMTSEQVMVSASKLETIRQIKEQVSEKMKVSVGSQRMYFMGKELENDFNLHDYSVKVNDMIQLFVRKPLGEDNSQNISQHSQSEQPKEGKKEEEEQKVKDSESEHAKVTDEVDCRDEATGAWFEARVERITVNDEPSGADKLTYHVKYEGYDDIFKVRLDQLRPRAKTNIPFLDLDLKMEVMVNYNIEKPEERGFWYDAKVTAWRSTSTTKVLKVTIIGPEDREIKDCEIKLRDEVFRMEKVSYATRPASGRATASAAAKGGDKCTCRGNKEAKCRKCGCRKCGGREDDASMILCDECDAAYHPRCVGFISTTTDPDEEWYCPDCKNDNDIVGGKIKMTKKKTGEGRDWGRGFACQGRTKECNKVPKNHFGAIPGIEVGMSWFRRIQVSEEGIHRPPVAGISGTAKEGCQSIVLAGGYEDDEDNGDSFTYTGSGGRDLSGNKRTAEQSHDQELTKSNAAIAMNCKASFNNKDGGDAGSKWREGKPIRVVRSSKGKKHSEYAPEEGNRYDGLYKVVKYWPAKGKKGFMVWRYLLRRDDPSPAPWTEEGKRRIEEEGHSLIYPEGYLEHQRQLEEDKKRKAGAGSEEDDEDQKENQPSKKAKTTFKMSTEWLEAIKKDSQNSKIWDQVVVKEVANKKELTDFIEELFNCIICQDIVFKPLTTPCGHNFCLQCLERSFQSGTKACPSCRAELEEKFKKYDNKNLKEALKIIFPGYETGR